MGSRGSFPVKKSQSTARLSANSAAQPAKTSSIVSASPQIFRTMEFRPTKSFMTPCLTFIGPVAPADERDLAEHRVVQLERNDFPGRIPAESHRDVAVLVRVGIDGPEWRPLTRHVVDANHQRVRSRRDVKGRH